MKYIVEATDKYVKERISDSQLAKKKKVERYKPYAGERWEVDENRKNVLVNGGFVKVIEEINEDTKKEKADIKETIKEDKREERPMRRRIRKD